MFLIKNQKGIAALLIVVIIGVASLIMAYSVSFLGLGELDLGYTAQKGQSAFAVADGCVEEALRRLKLDTGYTGGSLEIGGNSCIINITGAGSSRTIVSTGIAGDYSKKIQTNISISGNIITIDSWEELSS